MHSFLPEIAGLLAGLLLRRRAAGILRALIRCQVAVITVPLSLLGGMVFDFKPVNVISMVVVISSVMAGLLIGSAWYRRSDGRIGIAKAASAPNSGMWNIPIANAFLGPAAVVWLAVYDIAAAPANLLLTKLLRRAAPMRQQRRSGVIDYAPPLALAAGVAYQFLVGKPGLTHVLVDASFVNISLGMAVVGMAVPLERPRLMDAHVLPAAFALRWCPGLLALALLTATGVHPPTVAWLIAIAPAFFSQLNYCALYGYDRRQALLIVLTTIVGALALLPLVLTAW